MSTRPALKLALLLSLACVLYSVSARPFEGREPPPPSDGRAIAAVKCAACHTFQATEQPDPIEMARSKAPTLAYSGSKFKPGWMAKWLAAPYRIRPAGYLPYRYVVSAADGDQVDKSLLPEHPSLIDVEAEAVAAYLESLKKELNASEPAQVVTEVRAQVHFEKILGCSACHQSRPGLGGLSAPELYTAAERLDRRWATAFISDPTYWRPGLMPKPSMRKEQMGAIVEYLFQTAERQGQTRPLAAKVEGARALASTDGAPPSNDRARTLYLVYCSQCHGVQGNGKGINAPFMFVSPRNHTSREEMGMLTDERLYAAIKLGGNAVGRSAMMPAWGAVIKDSDIQLLVEYLRSLSGGGTVGGR